MSTKGEVVISAREYAESSPGRAFRALLNTWISDLRIKNDTAIQEDVIKNQGAIRELKLILKAITPTGEREEFDGGYGA